ncbi:MAG TPA: hypothetical protein IAD09_04305 [Candidatus Caccoplasma merdavium]|nr:hypothetical protein [Candidatus Caccoplasma merdavium]
MQKNKISDTLFQCSAVAVLLGAATYTFIPDLPAYFLAVGSLGMFLTRLTRRYAGSNLRLRRLYRQELFSSLIFMGAAALMFWRGGTDWVVLFIVATILQVYAAILIPREEAKEKRE